MRGHRLVSLLSPKRPCVSERTTPSPHDSSLSLSLASLVVVVVVGVVVFSVCMSAGVI